MTTIIKNQIVKQLARFTKNLSPSKINLKFLKGEGELRNLELNETFLSELLELPPFIRLTRAVCNKISAKIHWTRLKTDPIRLFLDCVEVEMEMTENVQDDDAQEEGLKQNSTTAPPPKASEYGFVEKVVDGMHVTINSVIMAFRTPTFKATFQMSHLSVHSTDHNWAKASLRNTRIKDEACKEVLTFKQITFGTLRVDADALYKGSEEKEAMSSAPLRLITSAAKLNIVIKKRMLDCSVISARLHVILDDVLWVLTHAQLRAVAGFAKSVVQVVEKSKKIEPAPSVASDDSITSQTAYSENVNEYYAKPTSGQTEVNPSSLFQREDVKETSYRVTTGKIDIHLCDDTPMDAQGQSGSMQIVVNNLSFEHYPYHLAFTSRVHWPSHNEASLTRAQWVQELFSCYKKVMGESMKKSSGKSANQRYEMNASQPSSRQEFRDMLPMDQTAKKRPHIYLYECAFVISCEEFIVMPVATSEKGAATNTPFLCSDKKSLYLPNDICALQFDYTLYFYPGQEDAKVPQPNLFCQLNPLHLTMDDLTCIWFHRFMQSIRSGFMWAEKLIAAQGATPRHIDVRIDGLMPKITLPCPSDANSLYDQFRPQAIQIYMSSFRASNTRIGAEFKQSNLVETLDMFLKSKLYTDGHSFPNHPDDTSPLPHFAWLNDFSVLSSGLASADQSFKDNHHGDRTSVVWMLNTRQCWCDFVGVDEAAGRPRPFVEPFPLRVCMCYPILPNASREPSRGYYTREFMSKPSALPLHRSPSDPYSRHPKHTSSARSTPSSSPGFARVHKTRSVTSVNIPVLTSEYNRERNTNFGTFSSDESNDSLLGDLSPRPFQLSRDSVDKQHLYVNRGPKNNPLLNTSDGLHEQYPSQQSCCAALDQGDPDCRLSILLYVPSALRLKLDHFQFVFLMRLQERFVSLRDTLYSDLEEFEIQRRKLQQGDRVSLPETKDDGIVVSLISKGAEVSLLVPAPSEEKSESVPVQTETPREGISPTCDPEPAKEHRDFENSTGSRDIDDNHVVEEGNEWTIVNHKGEVGSLGDTLGPRDAERSPSDASESESSSQSFPSDRSCPGRSVSTVTIRSKRLECAVTLQDDDFAFKLLVADCSLNEGALQNLETFLNQRLKKGGVQQEEDSVKKCAQIKLRYALGSTLDQSVDGAVENGLAHIVLSDVNTSVLQSSLDGVLECVSDEIDVPPPFIPVVIDLRDLDITINADTPPRLLSLPPALPTRLHVDQVTVLRTAAGGFEVKSCSPSDAEEMALRVVAMRDENRHLRKEVDISKEAKEVMESERERLLVTVKRLTDELVKSNRENDELQELLRQFKSNSMS